jgi:spoIIIJ-associated protein
MEDVAQAAQKIGEFLQAFTQSGFRLRYRIKLRGAKAIHESEAPEAAETSPRSLYVEFSGPDASLLTARNGELLDALEHLATKILRIEPESKQQVTFEANQFRANRDRRLRESAAAAVEHVRATGRPHPFPAMNARERRMLHLILSESGLPTASSGEGAERYVVLYPANGQRSNPNSGERIRPRDPAHIREAFRHR